jgi:cell division protein FtsB
MKRALLHLFRTARMHLTPARILTFAVVGVIFWVFILGDQGVAQLQHLQEMKHRLLTVRHDLAVKIDRLSQERDLLSDPAHLEAPIRSELGYIRPGEIVFEEK